MAVSLFVALLAVGCAHGLAVPDALPSDNATHIAGPANRCRCFPGDPCWPTDTEWGAFNRTVGGRLVATIPIAAVCHDNPWVPYDAEACAALQATWDYPQTHYPTSSSPMAPFFANASCDPFTARSAQCVIGSQVQYAVNATGVGDYQKTLAFAKARNLRLVIRNTGHDYFGKSTGAGALEIWTHHLKHVEFIPEYQSSVYRGKAFKFGAGVQMFEAYAAADAAGVTIVGGDCDTVGIVGGYSQGGGHGPLMSRFGLGADQVLAWEVVTANGQHLVADADHNKDLYWALSGGGGGTYAAVLSATVRAHEDLIVSGGNLTFTSAGVSDDDFYSAMQTFLLSLPAMADAGTWSAFQLISGIFILTPLFGPGLRKENIQALLEPTLKFLDAKNFTYSYNIQQYDKFYDGFNNLIPFNNITEYNIGGRLIPRSLVVDDESIPPLMNAIKYILGEGGGIAGSHFNVSRFPLQGTANAVNPVWRDSIFDAVLGLPYDYLNFTANFAVQDQMTNVLMPALKAVTPGGGSYLNEADFRDPDWQSAFYGVNYPALKAVKDKYDPAKLFFGPTAVGSEEWVVEADGRLCRA
ncbi:hypothetical protein GGR50DRAFT_651932 [Xylaria sp. CBS 124048]|nr:hypothetical protein GGR50DRAFT_651932 [Xylaria sp. CBS 124048]